MNQQEARVVERVISELERSMAQQPPEAVEQMFRSAWKLGWLEESVKGCIELLRELKTAVGQ